MCFPIASPSGDARRVTRFRGRFEVPALRVAVGLGLPQADLTFVMVPATATARVHQHSGVDEDAAHRAFGFFERLAT